MPVSPGELLDKITILRIKAARIADAGKLANVRRELSLLEEIWQRAAAGRSDLEADETALTEVNTALWDIEDAIRAKEAARQFDAGFVELARSVYRSNDLRAAIKRRVNLALGSQLVEEKSYRPY